MVLWLGKGETTSVSQSCCTAGSYPAKERTSVAVAEHQAQRLPAGAETVDGVPSAVAHDVDIAALRLHLQAAPSARRRVVPRRDVRDDVGEVVGPVDLRHVSSERVFRPHVSRAHVLDDLAARERVRGRRGVQAVVLGREVLHRQLDGVHVGLHAALTLTVLHGEEVRDGDGRQDADDDHDDHQLDEGETLGALHVLLLCSHVKRA